MKTWVVIVAAVSAGALAAAAMRPEKVVAPKPPLPRVQGTRPADLDTALSIASTRLAQDPADAPAAVRAAEILLRKARVERHGGFALQAEQVLEALLDREPSDYSALKMLGAVYASQHRFREAIAIANRAIAAREHDAWNYGTLGDAYLELGEWERAFDAFDTMVRLRPDAASCTRARISFFPITLMRAREPPKPKHVGRAFTARLCPKPFRADHKGPPYAIPCVVSAIDRAQCALERRVAERESA